MKKILLATSALVAMSGVAVAGDITETMDAAPVVGGWTVEVEAEIKAYAFTNTFLGINGFGAAYDASLTAKKTLEDGADVWVTLGIDSSLPIWNALIGYKSSLGEIKIGVLDNDDHGVEVPSAPSRPDLPDFTAFVDDDLSPAGMYVPAIFALTPPALADYSVTYASPEFGGFQLGAGINAADFYDIAVAGSFAAGDATVEVGVGVTGNIYGGPAFLDAGASVAINGFTVGADVQSELTTSTLLGYAVGAEYANGPFTVGAGWAHDAIALTDVVSVGAAYSDNGLEVAAGIDYLLVANLYVADLGVLYTKDAITVGAGVATDGVLTTGHAGVDFALNSNVTVGAGVYATNFAGYGAAAGVVVNFN